MRYPDASFPSPLTPNPLPARGERENHEVVGEGGFQQD